MEERDTQRLLANQQDPAVLIRAVFVPVDIILEKSNTQAEKLGFRTAHFPSFCSV